MFKKITGLVLIPQLFVVVIIVALLGHFSMSTDKPVQAKEDSGDFMIVAIPDTQIAAMFAPYVFEAQTKWIANQKEPRNIVFASHLGDIVEHATVDAQWRHADRAMRHLDGKVPYGIAPGNHDLEPDGTAPLYEKYFPASRLRKTPGFVGSYPSTKGDKNNYRIFTAGGSKYVALNLEFCPPDAVLDWADGILAAHPDHKAIISTHSFLNAKAKREPGSSCPNYASEGDNGGQEIWGRLVVQAKHDNIFLFLSGHDIWTHGGAARRTDKPFGKPVHQLLSDYQHISSGIDGYLRLLTFKPSEKKITVETYSPFHNQYVTDPENKFELNL